MDDTAFPDGPRRAEHVAGDRAPPFTALLDDGRRFTFDSAAGRWLVVGLVGSLADGAAAASVARAMAAELFDDAFAALFLVTCDPADCTGRGLATRVPGRRVYVDPSGAVARLWGALPPGAAPGQAPHARFWAVLDPGLYIRRILPMRADGAEVAELLAWLRRQPPPGRHMGFDMPVPVLVLPDVFEPALCDRLIALYEAEGGAVSGFMREEDGRTVARHDPAFKSRRDVTVSDPALLAMLRARILRKVVPELARVHFFRATRMERSIVCCYDAGEGGHFRAHRDNTTSGTAHRRFAVSINLNEDFEGGAVSFPEYGPRGIRAPRGAAVVFSCALLHEVGRVTRGRRYAFLPFLYDEAAARLRAANAPRVDAAPEPLAPRASR